MDQDVEYQTDPITSEVVRNKLEGIANEMQSTLFRSSYSPIVKEGLDASASLFTIEGETLAQAIALPFHLATLIPMVRKIIEEFNLNKGWPSTGPFTIQEWMWLKRDL
mgnify:CR=1 FL=1